MRQHYPQTLDVITKEDYQDAWWVNVNGETLPEPQELDQAKSYKPPRSRAKVLLLHTSLKDEWVPVRLLESLLDNYGYTPERAAQLQDKLRKFASDLKTGVRCNLGSGILRDHPDQQQMSRILASAERAIRCGEFPDIDKLLQENCPECFDQLALQHPDHYEDAFLYREGMISDGTSADAMFLNDEMVFCDVLHAPSVEQIIAVLRTNKNIGIGENEEATARRLARALARRFPELVKQTPAAQAFFANKAPASARNTAATPPPLVQTKTTSSGKRETTITINIWSVLLGLLVLYVAYRMVRCII